MKISIYTFARNAIYYDYHIVDMLLHHLDFADEIIVNEGYSTDDTFNRIKRIDSKIKIYKNKWDTANPIEWLARFKNEARKLCTGDWCILLDADEFIPEWEFSRIRCYLSNTNKVIIPMKYVNFYGNYKVYNKNPKKYNWPEYKYSIHKNISDLEIVGDGSNVAFKDASRNVSSSKDESPYANERFECHHFGVVRKPARLREKWHSQALRDRGFYSKEKKSRWDWVPGFVYNLFPYKWTDPQYMDSLAIYEGPYIKAVRDNPNEFVRDNFEIYEYLLKKEKLKSRLERGRVNHAWL